MNLTASRTLLSLFALLSASQLPGVAETVQWRSSAQSARWSDAENWSTQRSPATGDDVVLPVSSQHEHLPIDNASFEEITLHSVSIIPSSGPEADVAIQHPLNVGKGGIQNGLLEKSLVLRSGALLTEPQKWSGTRTIFVSQILPGSQRLTIEGITVRFDAESPQWSTGIELLGGGIGMSSQIGSDDQMATPWGTGPILLGARKNSSDSKNRIAFGSSATQDDPITISNSFIFDESPEAIFTAQFDISGDAKDSSPRYHLTGAFLGGHPSQTLTFNSSTSQKHGLFALYGQCSHAAPGIVNSRTTLLINGEHRRSRGYEVRRGATFGGTGTIIAETAADIIIHNGAKLSPGDRNAGTLTLDLGDGALDIGRAVNAKASSSLIFTLKSPQEHTSVHLTNAASVLNIGNGNLEFDDLAITIEGNIPTGEYRLIKTLQPIIGKLGNNLQGEIATRKATLSITPDHTSITLTVE